MLDPQFLRNLEKEHTLGDHYKSSEAMRALEIMAMVAEETDQSLLEIADRACDLINWPVKPDELLAVYLGMYMPYVGLDLAISKAISIFRDERLKITMPLHPAVAERYLRDRPAQMKEAIQRYVDCTKTI